MKIMINRGEGRRVVAGSIYEERVLLPLTFSVVEAVIIVGIIDVELRRVDSNDRSLKIEI